MDLTDEAWTVVKGTPGVTGFVGAGAKPVPLSQREVDRILHTAGAGGGPAAKSQAAVLARRVGQGHLRARSPTSTARSSTSTRTQQKLKVLVDIFERQVPVELGFDQVKKID